MRLLFRVGLGAILFVELLVFVVQVNFAATNEGVDNILRDRVEDVAIRDDNRGLLADLKRAKVLLDAKNFR